MQRSWFRVPAALLPLLVSTGVTASAQPAIEAAADAFPSCTSVAHDEVDAPVHQPVPFVADLGPAPDLVTRLGERDPPPSTRAPRRAERQAPACAGELSEAGARAADVAYLEYRHRLTVARFAFIFGSTAPPPA